MAPETRRSRNAELTVDQHLHAHDDDLDDGGRQFVSMRREVRAQTVMIFMLMLTIIGGLVGVTR